MWKRLSIFVIAQIALSNTASSTFQRGNAIVRYLSPTRMRIVDGLGLPIRNGVLSSSIFERSALEGGGEERIADALQKSGMQPLMHYFPAGRVHRPSDPAFIARYFQRT
uniref:Uncharacterized protein n=1 Tax=Parascaris univalens TaxID=6257 RepID=A0A915B5Z2_PARUN